MPSTAASVPDPAVQLLWATDRLDLPWRNGGGLTTEVAVSPAGGADAHANANAHALPGSFGWRLSIATVDSAAPFSRFEGVDRVLMALSEPGLDLIDEGKPVHLDAFESHGFAGENCVASANVVTPTRDLNLMTTRGEYSGALESHVIAGPWSVAVAGVDTLVVVVTQGVVILEDSRLNDGQLKDGRLNDDRDGGVQLEVLDAVRLDGAAAPGTGAGTGAGASRNAPATLTLSGAGRVAVARLRPAG